MTTYNIRGTFEGQQINMNVEAFSSRQAKFKSAFGLGLNGPIIGKYMKTNSIKVRRLK